MVERAAGSKGELLNFSLKKLHGMLKEKYTVSFQVFQDITRVPRRKLVSEQVEEFRLK